MELKQEGLKWSNIAIPAIEDDQISFLIIVVMMIIDTVLYIVITWYIEGVYPGRYGVAKPWYFPVMRSYWCGQRFAHFNGCGKCNGTKHEVLIEEEVSCLPDADNCEDDPKGLPLGIAIQKLSKKFSSCRYFPRKQRETLAINDLSVNFYEGQITAFLGHNGAGKTTTM